MKRPVDYYALDLSHSELKRTLKDVGPGSFEYVRCHGLLGTYEDGKRWLQQEENVGRPKCILSMGSTIGSSSKPEAAEFLAEFAGLLNNGQCTNDGGVKFRPKSNMLLGLDGCKNEKRVFRAYNDSRNANVQFIANALNHANAVLGYSAFRQHEWKVVGEWNERDGCHSQFLVPLKDVNFEGTILKAGKKILMAHSHKYDAQDRATLWSGSVMKEVQSWTTHDRSYGELAQPCSLYPGQY